MKWCARCKRWTIHDECPGCGEETSGTWSRPRATRAHAEVVLRSRGERGIRRSWFSDEYYDLTGGPAYEEFLPAQSPAQSEDGR